MKIIKKIKNIFLNYIMFYKYKKYKNIIIKKQKSLIQKYELNIDKTAHVYIGINLHVRKNVSINVRKNANLKLGNNVFFNNNCIVTCRNNITILDDTIIGPNVAIFDHDHNYKIKDRKNNFIMGEIFIGKNVWIGANSCILKGSKIGDNCVIAAGSIVTGNVPANCIYYSKNNIKKIGDLNE